MDKRVTTSTGRRAIAMQGIPSVVAVPKFLTPKEIENIKEMKYDIPDLSWEDAIREIIVDSRKKKK